MVVVAVIYRTIRCAQCVRDFPDLFSSFAVVAIQPLGVIVVVAEVELTLTLDALLDQNAPTTRTDIALGRLGGPVINSTTPIASTT